jgi:hypothetical protein
MNEQIVMKTPSGIEAIKRKAGGKWSVGHRVMVDWNGNCSGMGADIWEPATIKKLYELDKGAGLTEYADVLFDGSDEVRTGYCSMFFGEVA